MMSHHWMKLAVLAALLAVAASCKTLDEGSASGTTGLPAASIPAETGTANCAGWNTWKFLEAATLERVTECLRTGADPKARDQRGNTPLHWAAWANKNPAVVDTLVKAVGADPNARDKDDETPLHGAAWANKNPAVAAALLKAGADPNARNKKGRTPLNLAVRYKNSPAVAALLKKAAAETGTANAPAGVEGRRLSASPNASELARTPKRGTNAETPLHWAAWANKNPAVAAALLKAPTRMGCMERPGPTRTPPSPPPC